MVFQDLELGVAWLRHAARSLLAVREKGTYILTPDVDRSEWTSLIPTVHEAAPQRQGLGTRTGVQ